MLTEFELDHRLRVADPAATQAFDAARARPRMAAPAPARRGALPSGRWALGAVAAAAVAVAIVVAALPGTSRLDVVERAAAAVGRDQVLHTVNETYSDDRLVGRSEAWTRHAAGDVQTRMVLRDADGRLVGEWANGQDGQVRSWDARRNVEDRNRDVGGIANEQYALLERAAAGDAGVTRLADAEVRGVPVYVVAIEAGRVGSDPAPRRVLYLDKTTFLPVRVTFGAARTEILRSELIPLDDGGAEALKMGEHPGATVRPVP